MRSLVIWSILHACESWMLTAKLERRIQVIEMRCFRKLLGITYRDRISNEEVRNWIKQAIGPHDDLLATIRHRKLKWYPHVTRSSGLAKTTLQGTVRGGRKRGRQKRWEDNIKEWTGLELSYWMEGVGCQDTCGAPTVHDYGWRWRWRWRWRWSLDYGHSLYA